MHAANLKGYYHRLLRTYGPQGWWPLRGCKGSNPPTTGSTKEYHPGDYAYPRTERQRFEMCVGAILTQNTAWSNVETALRNLDRERLLDPHRMLHAEEETLRRLIRPAGYFNQKAKKLRIFATFYVKLNKKVPSREELLGVWGVGPETADSILLYAYKQPEFVVDTYTKRILRDMKIIRPNASYEEVKVFCVRELPRSVKVYQEFHALLVEHAKRLKNA